MKEIHAFRARQISQTNYKVNLVMDEIFRTIEENAKLGMFYAKFISILYPLNEEESLIVITRLKALSYKVTQRITSLEVEWDKHH